MIVLEALIELIFDNIYIVIGLLFFVYKIFGSVTGGNKKPTSMPTFGGEDQKRWDDDELDNEETYPTQSQPSSVDRREVEVYQSSPSKSVQSSLGQSNAASYSSFDEIKLEQLRKQTQSNARSTSAKINVTQNSSNTASQVKGLRSQDLRQAVIWSEILGQPRAKRHYRK